jgi:tRNA nucleotidyltransferase/poly(A) polymerase
MPAWHIAMVRRSLVSVPKSPFRLLQIRLLASSRSNVKVIVEEFKSPVLGLLGIPDKTKNPRVSKNRGETMRIRLNNAETQIVKFLQATENYFNETREEKNKVRAYFVGGWIRDKMRGMKNSLDIDVLVTNISPSLFVQTMVDMNVMKPSSRLTAERVFPEKVIEDGKDLRIGTYKFTCEIREGTIVEMVGIVFFPFHMKVEFAAPRSLNGESDLKADATERELTINALYMRVKDLSVWDPTQIGMSDLNQRILRTPKAPVQTYLDDPIRVLRAIRFVNRFKKFRFDIPMQAALTDDSVRVNSLLDGQVNSSLR